MTHGALPAAEWLKNTVGIRYEPHNLFQFDGNSVKPALIPVGQTGTEYITKLSALAQKEKIPVVTGMKAVALIKNKDGRVVGVSCELTVRSMTSMLRAALFWRPAVSVPMLQWLRSTTRA